MYIIVLTIDNSADLTEDQLQSVQRAIMDTAETTLLALGTDAELEIL